MGLKPISVKRLTQLMRRQAHQLKKPYEERHEDFEEDAVAWTLRTAAKQLTAFERRCKLLEQRLIRKSK
jgi:hypothetical protein